VHDELLFEVPAKERTKLAKLVKEEMEGVLQTGRSHRCGNWAPGPTGATWIDFGATALRGIEKEPPGILSMVAAVKLSSLELVLPAQSKLIVVA